MPIGWSMKLNPKGTVPQCSTPVVNCTVALLNIVPLGASIGGEIPKIALQFPSTSHTKFWPKGCNMQQGYGIQ
jgi:hypothetical protein